MLTHESNFFFEILHQTESAQPHNEWKIKSEAHSHQTPTTKGACSSQESCCYGNHDDLSDMESFCEEVKARWRSAPYNICYTDYTNHYILWNIGIFIAYNFHFWLNPLNVGLIVHLPQKKKTLRFFLWHIMHYFCTILNPFIFIQEKLRRRKQTSLSLSHKHTHQHEPLAWLCLTSQKHDKHQCDSIFESSSRDVTHSRRCNDIIRTEWLLGGSQCFQLCVKVKLLHACYCIVMLFLCDKIIQQEKCKNVVNW